MSVFSNLHAKFLTDVINQSGKKVNILDKNAGILHSYNTSTLELVVFQIEMELSTTLGLSLICPVNRGTTLRGKGNGNDCSFTKWFCFQTVNNVLNLVLHLHNIKLDVSFGLHDGNHLKKQ